MEGSDTIVAVATPSGRGALALLRLSGPDVFTIVGNCLLKPEKFENEPPRRVTLYSTINPANRRVIDQVTIIKYHAPQSFTGESMVEIVCHGGVLVVRELVEALKTAGARGAGKGEFTRRALLHGKLDLLQAEAIQGIIDSESPAALSCARSFYSGSAQRKLLDWKERLDKVLEGIERGIEFEEDVTADNNAGKELLSKLSNEISLDLKRRERIKFLERGAKIVIAGPANAGKSTLFNKLLGFHRAIVHSEPGTTRDLVSERVKLGGIEVQLIDCAGIRSTEDEIERAGIEKSRQAMNDAAVVIWVTAADEKGEKEEFEQIETLKKKAMIGIINKIDRGENKEKENVFKKQGIPFFRMSLHAPGGIDEFESAMVDMVEKESEREELPEFILNERHGEIAKATLAEMREALSAWERAEIAAMHIRGAIGYFDEIFGKSDMEGIMNGIFEKFCVGK